MERSTIWMMSHRAEPIARKIADRHYNRQKIGARGFVPPGRCVVLRGVGHDAVWVTSWPFAQYVRHAWAGAWVNSLFRRESGPLASEMIRDAIAITRGIWPDVPPLGLVTFINTMKVKPKRNPGYCYLRAGFLTARCPEHFLFRPNCAACSGRTVGGLVAVQIHESDMPEPMLPCISIPSVRRVASRP